MKRLFKIDYLSRVEGETGISAEIRDGEVTVRAGVFEAPRFFESFLRGRHYSDIADFTARICGICPVAYQMSAIHAIERIFGVEVEEPIGELRRLLYCGEWIESHALHIYLLQGPDFYGAESAWAKKDYLPIAKRGLSFKKLGNRILALLGGRPIHPVSVKVGGFSKLPEKKSLLSIIPDLGDAYVESLSEIERAARLPFQENAMDTECVSLCAPREYPMNHGNVISNRGINTPMAGFFAMVRESQVKHSTALHSKIRKDNHESPYLVGPISRVNLNAEKLPEEITTTMKKCGISLPIMNTRMGIIARSIELSYALHEAMRIIRAYKAPSEPSVRFEPREGEAAWITEAPRGILIHRYELDHGGYVKDCTLIPPTSQNLAQMEIDLRDFIQNHIDKPVEFLKKESEKIVRSYDPCISCSVHLVVIDGNKKGKPPCDVVEGEVCNE
jgi:coenzyme F420-reducing hydrogenase alpha subunit